MSELIHGLLHASQANVGETKLIKWGHVSSYDPDKNAVKVIIMQDEDDEPCETNWITLGAGVVGDKFGVQYALKGGATKDEPEKGEQVQIHILERGSGHMTTAHLSWNEEMTPPGGGNKTQEEEDQEAQEEEDGEKFGWDEDPKGRKKLEGGEQVSLFEGGCFLKFYKDGSVQIFTKKDLHIYAKEEANIVVREGDLNVTVEKGDMNVLINKGNLEATLEEGDLDCKVELGNTTIDTPFGDTSITSEEGSIIVTTESGDIALSTMTGEVTIEATAATVIADGLINLIAPIINAGVDPATVQRLCNEAFLILFNNHIHPAPGGVTGAPTNQAIVGFETTVDFAAS